MANIECIRVNVNLYDGGNEADILIISDPATIVDLGPQEVEHLVWDIIVFVKQHPQLFLADHQIFICELISNVPTNGPELSSVLNDSMEEAESE